MSAFLLVYYTVTFLLELAMVYGFGRFGFVVLGGGFAGVIAALVLASGAMTLWFFLASPKAPYRLTVAPLFVFKFAILGLGGVAYWLTGWEVFAALYLAVAVADLGVALASGRL